MGASTYIASRYFHQALALGGKNVFTLTHHSESTTALFELTKRYFDNLPMGFAPTPVRASKNELKLDQVNSWFSTATCGGSSAGSIGRGFTISLAHLSEAAFYPDPQSVVAGLLQAVPRENSEVIIESTANGLNYLHQQWQLAVHGESNFIPIFTP
jgi:hypothetical protein